MDNTKNNAYYSRKIKDDLAFIMKHMSGVDEEELGNSELLLDSMMFRLIQISENSRKLTDDYKAAHDQIPWVAMYGLRNRIVHDYGSVDLGIVYATLKENIPELLEIFDQEPGV